MLFALLRSSPPARAPEEGPRAPVIRLAAKDAVAAEKAFNAAMQTPGFGASDEATVCDRAAHKGWEASFFRLRIAP